MQIRWARSATKHRIARDRSRYVIETATAIIRQPPPVRSVLKDERIVFLGADQAGEPLEVMAVETSDELVVIHAMKLRRRYEPYLKESKDARH